MRETHAGFSVFRIKRRRFQWQYLSNVWDVFALIVVAAFMIAWMHQLVLLAHSAARLSFHTASARIAATTRIAKFSRLSNVDCERVVYDDALIPKRLKCTCV